MDRNKVIWEAIAKNVRLYGKFNDIRHTKFSSHFSRNMAIDMYSLAL